MNATEIAAALSVRAEDVCRRYLPRGRKQGRYWTVGDTNGAKGRSLFVRLALRAYPRTPKKSHPMNATEIAAALSVRAEDVCRRYLPRGRKQGRYWTVGDTNGAKGRSLFVRLALRAYPRNGPTPRTTSMDICSISSVCAQVKHRCGAPWRRPSRSSHCRRPLPPMAAPPRVRWRCRGTCSGKS